MQSAFSSVSCSYYRDCLFICRFFPPSQCNVYEGFCKEKNKAGWQLLTAFVKSHAAIMTSVRGTVCPESTCNYRARLCVPPSGESFLLGMASGHTRGKPFFIRRVQTTKGQGCNQTHATPPENSLHVSSGNSRWTLKHPGPLSGGSDCSRSHNRQRKIFSLGMQQSEDKV